MEKHPSKTFNLEKCHRACVRAMGHCGGTSVWCPVLSQIDRMAWGPKDFKDHLLSLLLLHPLILTQQQMQTPIPYTEGGGMDTASKPKEEASLQNTNPQNTNRN